MPANYYDTDRAVAEYLLFHYGLEESMLPPGLDLAGKLHFPIRCVSECMDVSRLPAQARALDLGCAVGRASFELARRCTEVVGIDYSEHFIKVASHIKKNGSFVFSRAEEGDITRPMHAIVPPEIERQRVSFEAGDALNLRADLGSFDVVLLANLIDRLADPRLCLDRMPSLVKPGGQLIITSPYTWLLDYTPREHWLGGIERDRKEVRTLDALKEMLAPDFQFSFCQDLPFVIREHARKFQLCVAEASVWFRK
jgi:putative 4-mercaptohistidine N1-methyltranferase